VAEMADARWQAMAEHGLAGTEQAAPSASLGARLNPAALSVEDAARRQGADPGENGVPRRGIHS
jgi:hypothetical protein